jgi:hypothetical protein
MFIGPIFSMRLKHMVEDKWNARGKGRREQRTHQPTGGRGAQGGLRIGEMERDAITGHGISAFIHESYMLRSDGVSFRVCKGCGTIPIENPKTGFFVCPTCTGPLNYIGSGATDLELIPPIRKTMVAPVTIEMPYAFKVLAQELETYMNIGMRIMTEKDLVFLDGLRRSDLPQDTTGLEGRHTILPERVLPEAAVPEYREEEEGPSEASPELLMKLGAIPRTVPLTGSNSEGDVVVDGTGSGIGTGQAIATAAAAAANLQSSTPGVTSGTLVQTEQGPMFQPNPTTVTVVPPARTINILPGEGEEVDADEVLGAGAGGQAPLQLQPQQQPQQQVVQQGGGIPQYPYPMPYSQPYGYPPQFQPPYGYPGLPQMPQMQGYPSLNTGGAPAIYANSVPPPGQLYTSGVPGAPPTFAVQTDPGAMGSFLSPQIKPRKANITLRKGRGVSFGSGSGSGGGNGSSAKEENQSGGGSVVVTVSKMG